MLGVALLFATLVPPGCAKQTPPAEQALAMTVAEETSATSGVAASEPREITFDLLKFEVKKGQAFQREMLGQPIEELFGKRIRITGFMYPGSMLKPTAERFVLIRDNQDACYGLGNMCPIHDLIDVHMHPGDAARFSNKKIELEGVLGFEEVRDTSNQQTVAIYRLKDAVVR
jgi:hypothetical protein